MNKGKRACKHMKKTLTGQGRAGASGRNQGKKKGCWILNSLFEGNMQD